MSILYSIHLHIRGQILHDCFLYFKEKFPFLSAGILKSLYCIFGPQRIFLSYFFITDNLQVNRFPLTCRICDFPELKLNNLILWMKLRFSRPPTHLSITVSFSQTPWRGSLIEDIFFYKSTRYSIWFEWMWTKIGEVFHF